MNNFTSSLALILVVLATTLTLSGCSHNPTLQESKIYLQAQAQQVQINTYRSQLQSNKKRLTEVIPETQTSATSAPPSLLADLTTFLVQNDCTKFPSNIKDQCYKVTQVKLIEVTRLLDEARVQTYLSQRTVGQLVTNLNVLIESMGEPPPSFGIEE